MVRGNYCFTVLGGKVITLFSLSFLVFLKLVSCLVVFFLPSHKMTKAWVFLVCFGLFAHVLRGVNILSYPAPPSLSLFLFIYWFCLLFLFRPHGHVTTAATKQNTWSWCEKRTDKQLKCDGCDNFYGSIAKKGLHGKESLWTPTGHEGNSKWTRFSWRQRNQFWARVSFSSDWCIWVKDHRRIH